MKYYMAPIEGITTYIFRNAYHRCFGGADKYITPFISGKNMSSRELNDVLPEHNEGICLVPQILTNRPDEFLDLAKRLEGFGYTSINLNLGCPSGTVVAKRRGAGLLAVPEELDRLLDAIFEKCTLKISGKTRIGISSLDEWDRILDIYAKYPFEELVIHPRLQEQGYQGEPHREAFAEACRRLPQPLGYSGDINSCEDRDSLLKECPEVETIVLGRGLVQRPWLVSELQGVKEPVKTELLQDFHEELLENYKKIMSGDTPTLFKMKDVWRFMSKSFEDSEKHLKKILKANRLSDYETAVKNLFEECPCKGLQA